jgi:SAM-dependent methyltransferase
MSHYRHDLAFIHDEGFGHLAAGGAGVLVAALERSGIHSGIILDFGCGSGVTARLLTDKGYSVVGFDLSEPLIGIARKRVPQATFHVESFIDAKMPPCVAVCAIGEVLNYRFDGRNKLPARKAFFESAYRSLVDGGVLLFDTAGSDRAPDGMTRAFHEGKDWAVLVETPAQAEVLTRRIVTYRRSGELHRRDSEVHELDLISPEYT